MINISERFENLKNQWKDSLGNSPVVASSSDPLSSEGGRRYFFEVLDKEFNRMNGILSRQRRLLSQKIDDTATSSSSTRYKNLAREVDLERIYDPPGTPRLLYDIRCHIKVKFVIGKDLIH